MPRFEVRIKAQFADVYLTLISVIQGCVLSDLFSQSEPLLANLNLRTVLFLTTTFFLIVLVWNEYMMWTSVVRWVPRLTDALLPMLMGVGQFVMIRLIPARSPAFILAMAGFLVTAWVKYHHGVVVGRRDQENAAVFDAMRWWNTLSGAMLAGGIVATLLIAWLDARFDAGEGAWPWSGVLLLAIPAAYAVRTIYYWRFLSALEDTAAAEGLLADPEAAQRPPQPAAR